MDPDLQLCSMRGRRRYKLRQPYHNVAVTTILPGIVRSMNVYLINLHVDERTQIASRKRAARFREFVNSTLTRRVAKSTLSLFNNRLASYVTAL